MRQPPSPELIAACEAFSLGDAKPALPLITSYVICQVPDAAAADSDKPATEPNE